MTNAVEMRRIMKRFPGGIVAVDDVSLTVERGEIHALIGENGAGKSTLMNVLAGLLEPDVGEILINGGRVEHLDSASASRLGIGMVHQHFMLIPVFTVAENVVLGMEPRIGLRFDRRAAEEKVRALSDQYGLKVDPTARVETLSVGQEQRVEILKVLHRGAGILILDEPTAVLTPQETKDLFSILLQLKSRGKTILFISHKLNEVMAIADRITVLRGGKSVGTLGVKEATRETLARMMVGREVLFSGDVPAIDRETGSCVVGDSRDTPVGEVLLDADRLEALRANGLPALRGVSFQVRSGEVLGIAGVEGNGQTELLEVLVGIRPATAGRVEMHDGTALKDVTGAPIAERFRLGLAHIPEDRHKRGLVLEFTVAENAVLGRQREPAYSGPAGLRFWAIDEAAAAQITRFDIRPPEREALAGALSGGNQQKVVVARELAREPRVLIAAQPTRGIDVGGIEIIHRHLEGARASGAGVLLVSSDLSELLALSDRIAVLYEGAIVATLDPSKTSEEELGLYMSGARRLS